MNKNKRSIKGDFIGFTLGNIHSSELGLVRVSEGGRYNQDLLPPLQDKKAQVTGRDGDIYFGSQYVTKPIKVPVAFDNMDETSFAKLRRLLSIKIPQPLWFDETPYKQWLVKSANAQNFKWICFDESRNGKKERIYKGEGVLEFNCFNPYATSRIIYLDEAKTTIDGNQQLKEDFQNFNEWRESSNLRYIADKLQINSSTKEDFNYGQYYENYNIDSKQKRGMFIYNAGDVPVRPKIVCKFPNSNTRDSNIIINLYSFNNSEKISLDDEKNEEFNLVGSMTIAKDIISKCGENGEQYVIIDSKLKMIKGVKEENSIKQLTGNIYNKYHKTGDYIEIPVLYDYVYFIEITEEQVMNDEGTGKITPEGNPIEISSIEYIHQYY